jgi:hypothetical protein
MARPRGRGAALTWVARAESSVLDGAVALRDVMRDVGGLVQSGSVVIQATEAPQVSVQHAADGGPHTLHTGTCACLQATVTLTQAVLFVGECRMPPLSVQSSFAALMRALHATVFAIFIGFMTGRWSLHGLGSAFDLGIMLLGALLVFCGITAMHRWGVLRASLCVLTK